MQEKVVKKWRPLESNVEILSNYAKRLGMQIAGDDDGLGVSFFEVFSFEEEMLKVIPGNVIGVILCYPLTKENEEQNREKIDCSDEDQTRKKQQDVDLFYIKQTIPNACGCIALLHILFNLPDVLVDDDSSLASRFLQSCQDKTPEERGLFMESENCSELWSVHEQMCCISSSSSSSSKNNRNEKGSYIVEPEKNNEFEADGHFVVFLSSKSSSEDGDLLIELDGRCRTGPKVHSKIQNGLLQDSIKIIKKLMQLNPNNLNFCVTCVCRQE